MPVKRTIVFKSDDWRRRAKCALPENRDLMWFPKDWVGTGQQQIRTARLRVLQVCNSCPVQAECRDYAERYHATSGIWAGRNYGGRGEEAG
jgi:Transcription factor WhiB